MGPRENDKIWKEYEIIWFYSISGSRVFVCIRLSRSVGLCNACSCMHVLPGNRAQHTTKHIIDIDVWQTLAFSAKFLHGVYANHCVGWRNKRMSQKCAIKKTATNKTQAVVCFTRLALRIRERKSSAELRNFATEKNSVTTSQNSC